MDDLNTLHSDFSCDDCELVFSDFNQFISHREHHTSLWRSELAVRNLLDHNCPFCLVKYSHKFDGKWLAGIPGLGKPRRKRGVRTKAVHLLRCKYYPECNAGFYRLLEYIQHTKEVHKDDKPYTCHQCNYTAPRFCELRRHLFCHMDCGKFNCRLCLKECASSEELEDHMFLIHNENKTKPKWRCYVCAKRFSAKGNLALHLKRHYRTFKCRLCATECESRELLNAHFSSNHKEANVESYECTYCSKRFFNLSGFKLHSSLHNRIPSKCHICSKEFPGPCYLKNHLKTHNRVHKCSQCEKEYRSRETLRSHMISSHSELDLKSHDCSYCPKKFLYANKLAKHVRKHMPTTETLKCHVCSEELSSKTSLVAHLNTHNRTFECGLCPKKYSSKYGLNMHLLEFHKEDHIKSYDCLHCDKKFIVPSKLKRHMNLHVPNPTKCHICSKEFSTEVYLKRHLKTHDKKFKCHLCSSEYAQKKCLEDHLLHHDNLSVEELNDAKKQFSTQLPSAEALKCHLCPKEFSSIFRLNEHIRTHFKVFKCDLCPKEYGRRESLKNHLLSSHKAVDIKSHDCSYCDKKFTLPSMLKRHLQKHLPTKETFKCDICSKELLSKEGLKMHLRKHNSLQQKKGFSCNRQAGISLKATA